MTRIKNRCPQCSRHLVERTNRKTKERFVGCTGYPQCKYTEPWSIAQQMYNTFKLDWRANLTNPAMRFLDDLVNTEKVSKPEIYHILGAAYFLDHFTNKKFDDENGVRLDTTKILYRDKEFDALAFFEPFQYWGGGWEPSAMAFVSQLPFGKKLHHDIGIFFGDSHDHSIANWELGLAVEIDIHPSHEFDPGLDMFRDRLVNYRVLRIRPEKYTALNWFTEIISYYDHWVETNS